MADVNTWDPLDEGNTSPSPDGWPEFMMPSGVNNSARAMMGAIRRLYDKQLSGELVLPYLKLTGGTVTGAVTVGGAMNTASISSSSTIYAASTISTGGALSASGSITGAAISATGNIGAGGGVYATGEVTAGGRVNASHYDIGGSIFANRNGGQTGVYDASSVWTLLMVNDGNNYYANNVHRFVNRGNTVQLAILDGGGLNVSGSISGVSLNVSGNVALGSALTVSGTSSLNGTTNLNGASFAGGIQYGNSGGRFWVNAEFQSASAIWAHNNPGNFGLVSDGDYWLRFRSDCGLRFQNSTANFWWQTGPTSIWVMSANGFCYAGANAAGGNGAYVNISDERLKQDIEPALQGLDVILGLNPVKFRRLPKEGMPTPRLEVGFVAQQVQEVFPEAVVSVELADDPEPTLGVTDGAILAAVVTAIKQIDQRLNLGGL